MSTDRLSRRTVAFINIAHALDHFVLLIYPTAVIAIAAETGLSYATLIGLSTGAFVAFGLFSLPMGWFADRLGRRNLLAGFFGGWVDTVLMRLADISLSLPGILIAVLLSVVFEPSFTNVIIVVVFLLWPSYARLTRGGGNMGAGPGSDLAALNEHKISVTPLRLDLTDEPFMTRLAELLG